MKKLIILIVLFCATQLGWSQKQTPTIARVEPPSWWVGMKEPNVQVMIYGQGISNTTLSIDYPGVEIKKVNKAENENYLFVDLEIQPDAKPGDVAFTFDYGKKKKLTHNFTLNPRNTDSKAFKGLNQGDVMYLITPDRFVNGNGNNDNVKGTRETLNGAFEGGRHGGDTEGIISKLDYLNDLGITAIWSSPLLENDMKEYSYHGYAITDYYRVDPRFGTNDLYKQLAKDLHSRDMKLVMDMVFNHCGLEHWWMKDMPFKDWIHDFPDYSITNYSIASLSDPHAALSDQTQMERGWFVSQMPDLNHDNVFMANYLIQNSIWWIEFAGLDGIRMDTYPYNKKEFMAEWASRVYSEYPDFYLVGETWVSDEVLEGFWTERGDIKFGDYNSNTKSMTDFPLCFAIHKAFQKDGDVGNLYNVLSKDFIYSNPNDLKIFVDNHDMDRIFHTVNEDVNKFKLAMTFLFTTRGIPQFYYGTEILMKGHGSHGIIREDFPGGWPTDSRDAFNEKGRTDMENDVYNFLSKLLNWRKHSDAILNGTLTHFIPYKNIYVYARKSDKESIVVLLNNTNEDQHIDMSRYNEILKGYEGADDILNDVRLNNLNSIDVPANTGKILKLIPQLKANRN